jgi:hypothetical protein
MLNMANTANNRIINSWSLKSFFQAHGKMKIANMKNSESGEAYKCLAFENPTSGALCFVSFSSNLGELTGSEIASMKDDLQVCELSVDDDVAARRAEAGHQAESYCLCKKGTGSWEDVDIDW